MIEKYCKMMCESCGRIATEGIIESWNMALKGIPNQYLTEGFKQLMQNKNDNYLSHPGELRKICRNLQKQNKQITRENSKNIERVNYQNVAPIKESVRIIVDSSNLADIKKSVSGKRLVLYRYDDSDFNIEKSICQGHINFDYFSDECLREYRKKPTKIAHEFHLFKKIVKKDSDGKYKSSHNTHISCQSHIQGAEQITVGYYNFY